jgi:lipoate-protein ligase A
MHKAPLHLLDLEGIPIIEQLRLEEALLRTDQANWCLLNRGSPPAIVLGIGGKVEELVDEAAYQAAPAPIPLVRRFSGGGTVVVDEKTLFVSFLFNSATFDFAPFPEAIMRWTAHFYAPLLPSQFTLRENDYVLGDKKFGGNAQCICKGRWLHHSTLLADYNPELMRFLKLPSRRPNYRESRSHSDFLCTLKEQQVCPDGLFVKIREKLAADFEVRPVHLDEAKWALELPHRKATVLLK